MPQNPSDGNYKASEHTEMNADHLQLPVFLCFYLILKVAHVYTILYSNL